MIHAGWCVCRCRKEADEEDVDHPRGDIKAPEARQVAPSGSRHPYLLQFPPAPAYLNLDMTRLCCDSTLTYWRAETIRRSPRYAVPAYVRRSPPWQYRTVRIVSSCSDGAGKSVIYSVQNK